jgi:type III secretion protein D
LNAPSPMTVTGEKALRVLNGRLAGAEHKLHSGKYVRVGHSFDHDIVLRGQSTAGISVELHLLDEIATLKVVAGEIVLLGRPVRAGEEAQLPFYMPASVGEFAIAVGVVGAERWQEAETLLTNLQAPTVTATSAMADQPQPATTAVTAPASPMERAITRFSPHKDLIDMQKHGPKLGLALGLILLIAIAAAPAYQWVDDQFYGPGHVQSMIAAQGFKDLKATRDPTTGKVLIRGTLRTDKELAKLRSFATAQLPDAVVEVQTTEAHAAAATEVLLAQGIEATAKPVAVSALVIEAEYMPKDRQDELIKQLQNDLPAVKKITFQTNDAIGEKDLQYFFSSSEHGLATMVRGEFPFIRTADGQMWYVGAKVPTGHTIISITDTSIRFERDGRIEELVL